MTAYLPPGLPGFAHRSGRLAGESAFDVLAVVNRLRAEGRPIISFGIGEPDFPTPPNIVEAAKAALDAGMTRYGPSNGLPELREAIASDVSDTRGIAVDAEQVVVAPGTKPLIFYTIATLVNEGDEVLYPNPGFPTYESVTRWLGATPVPMPLTEASEFGCDRDALAAAMTPRTKLIIINSPNNPTGGVLAAVDLAFIAELAVQHNCWVLSDEIYSRLVFDGEFLSIASLPGMQDRTIIVDGFSKTFAMTGWRIGYGVMHPSLASAMARVETNVESCTATFTQVAAIEALRGPRDEPFRFAREFAARAEVVVNLLNGIPGIRCARPRGAFYAFPNVSGACKSLGFETADEFAHALLHEADVAVLPRSCFGARNTGETDEYFRLTFATSMEQIHEGIARIKAFVERGRQ
ncbi:MAG: aspartate aminotransferase [Chloroflexi bacterium]|nr:aspartate aminotransferase [Chloroflexota bacterium]